MLLIEQDSKDRIYNALTLISTTIVLELSEVPVFYENEKKKTSEKETDLIEYSPN